METNTLLLIGGGILGALLALLLLVKIIKGILQMAYLLLVLGASGFIAYYIGTPEGSALLPQTVGVDVRLIQAGIVIVLPLLMSLAIGILVFIVRQVFKSQPKRRYIDETPTPVSPFHPPTQEELQQIQRGNAPPQYPQQGGYPAPPTIHTVSPLEETRPNPTPRRKK
jgi:hypothetical protein